MDATEIVFLRTIVHGLVKSPDKCNIDKKIDEMGVLLTVFVPQDEIGTVIGKGGEIAESIKKIMRAFGVRSHKRLAVKFDSK